MIEVQRYTSLEGKIFSDWEELWKNSPEANFVNSPYWLQAVTEWLPSPQYLVIAVYGDKKLQAVIGLVHEHLFGFSVYSVPPGDFVCGTPFLLRSESKEIVDAFTKALLRLPVVVLDNVPQKTMNAIATGTAKFTNTQYSVNHCLDFTFDLTGKVIVPKRKRMLREAKPIYSDLTFTSLAAADQKMLDIAFAIDTKSRKHTKGYNAFSDHEARRLYSSLIKYFGEYLRLNFLSYKNIPIVYEIGFFIQHTYYGSQIAFDEKYSEFAPGKAFEVKLIEYLASQGGKRVDYGSGDNFIKQSLASSTLPLYKVVLSSNIGTRLYLISLFRSKDILFRFLTHHPHLYSIYKNMCRLLHI